jgi:ElaA protein
VVRLANLAQCGVALSAVPDSQQIRDDRPMAAIAPPDSSNLAWRFSRFENLTVFELDAIYRARQLVFSVEQRCVYVDADGFDGTAFHLAGWSPERTIPMAYARIIPPGAKYLEPSVGRLITSSPVRGTGLGRELLRRAMAACAQEYPAQPIRISAQTRLTRFYAEAGFVESGSPYLEDGILHTEMLLAA